MPARRVRRIQQCHMRARARAQAGARSSHTPASAHAWAYDDAYRLDPVLVKLTAAHLLSQCPTMLEVSTLSIRTTLPPRPECSENHSSSGASQSVPARMWVGPSVPARMWASQSVPARMWAADHVRRDEHAVYY